MIFPLGFSSSGIFPIGIKPPIAVVVPDVPGPGNPLNYTNARYNFNLLFTGQIEGALGDPTTAITVTLQKISDERGLGFLPSTFLPRVLGIAQGTVNFGASKVESAIYALTSVL